MTRRAILAPAALLAAALTFSVTGCSQVAALAPVGGDRVTSVRYAVNDVLVAEGVDILTAPLCTASSDGAVSCEGEAVGGATITASSSADDQNRLVVEVGDRALYDGSLTAVLEDALEGKP